MSGRRQRGDDRFDVPFDVAGILPRSCRSASRLRDNDLLPFDKIPCDRPPVNLKDISTLPAADGDPKRWSGARHVHLPSVLMKVHGLSEASQIATPGLRLWLEFLMAEPYRAAARQPDALNAQGQSNSPSTSLHDRTTLALQHHAQTRKGTRMADLHQPHDRLFRAVFSDPGEAVSLLQANLPPAARDRFDWTTLALRSGTFIDEELRHSQSDLLFHVNLAGSETSAAVYVLLEHQSSPDRWMPLRLLRYMCRIWEADLRDDPEQPALRSIVPVVFYQGERRWTYSTQFGDLFVGESHGLPWNPRFSHELFDQTALEPTAIGGGVKGRIAQLLIMAAFNHHLGPALQLVAELLPLLTEAGAGLDERQQFYLYLLHTQDPGAVRKLRETLRQRGFAEGDEIMTYAEQLLAEGEAKGRAEGRLEERIQIVQGLIEAGAAWNIIETATGLTQAAFEGLKARAADTDS